MRTKNFAYDSSNERNYMPSVQRKNSSGFFKRQRSGQYFFKKSTLTGSADPFIQKEEGTSGGEQEEDKKEETEVGMGSPAFPWYTIRDLGLRSGRNWSAAFHSSGYSGFPLFNQELGAAHNYNRFMALYNLMYGGMFSATSPYPGMDFSKGLKMAESLSGVKDTYLNLGAIGLNLDLAKYLKEDFPDIAKSNLGYTLLYGLPAQAALTGISGAISGDYNATSILSEGTKPFTTPPYGYERLSMLGNIPDNRWKYPFWQLPSDLKLEWKNRKSEKPDEFSFGMGLNIPSLLGQVSDVVEYPESEEEQKKHMGPELFPFGSYSRFNQAEGDTAPEESRQWMLGAMGGYGGVLGMFAGGQRERGEGAGREDYLRSSLMLRNFGPLGLLQLGSEHSRRPEFGAWRDRLEAAAQFNILDRERWRLQAGARVSGLLPEGGAGGAFEGGGNLSFHYLHPLAGKDEKLRTGVDFSMMDRLRDPFDPAAGRLRSIRSSVNLIDFFRLSLEYHQARGIPEGMSGGLPGSDFRFMIYPGFGYFTLGK